MIVRRYLDPFAEINAIRRQINEAFGDLAETITPSSWAPAIHLEDRGDAFVLTANLAGVNSDDLNIQVSKDGVSLSGDRKAPENTDAKVLYDDVRYGAFYRLINLPDGVQNDQVEANFNNGVLTLTLPKVVEARNKVVKINVSKLNGNVAPAVEAAPETSEV